MKTMISLLMVLGLAVVSTAQADVSQTYTKSCAACHDSGTFNAPKKGDVATWNRLNQQKGKEALIKSTRQGMPQMPAMGLCQSCTDKDFAELIEYMSK
ncbi:c-type cytochrome [Moraxella canis]|uniref:c-type cytochrome n=1 Tax=Moraxella canis TaxID=90239 RepID=UPI000666B2CF|nr:c-type cytochrome [Moraxella canis]